MASDKAKKRKPRPLIVNMKILNQHPVWVIGFVNNREFAFKAEGGLWEYQMSLDPFKGVSEVIDGAPDFYKVSNTYMDAVLKFDMVNDILGAIFQNVAETLSDLDRILIKKQEGRIDQG